MELQTIHLLGLSMVVGAMLSYAGLLVYEIWVESDKDILERISDSVF